ncbi:MAG: 3-oxoacyl-ACP synthase [Frondihabitans sp.]|nr:3-oxoacyl-ACP synthase [Frondihabitans sp.]
MSGPAPFARIAGAGFAVPEGRRGDDDPVYQRVHSEGGEREAALFTGAGQRAVLGATERIETLMVEASVDALARATVNAEEIDRLYGYASVPAYVAPNPLYAVHGHLGLGPSTLVVPINSEFSNFVLGLVHAAEGVRSGSSTHALVVTGSNWTRHLDFTRGHAHAAGDGAGAAVVGQQGPFEVVDFATSTHSDAFESMTMGIRPRTAPGWVGIPVDANATPIPTYRLDPEQGTLVYETIMWSGLPRLVNDLLAKHGLDADDISLITHQGSQKLLDHWNEEIKPARYLETYQEYGNMTNATYPVNLARYFDEIDTSYVVIAAVGVGFHLTALLLKNRS